MARHVVSLEPPPYHEEADADISAHEEVFTLLYVLYDLNTQDALIDHLLPQQWFIHIHVQHSYVARLIRYIQLLQVTLLT